MAPPESPGAEGTYVFLYFVFLINLPLATEFIPQPPDKHKESLIFLSYKLFAKSNKNSS